jgi:tetratricopeptide (TPR) repeat protein
MTSDPSRRDFNRRDANVHARQDVPGYDLGDLIGRGGMGDVYRALDLEMDREVAVKILQERYPVDSQTAARFIEEAKITGQLQHPGIPAVYRVSKFPDGRPFLAMKLIRGDTLEDLLRSPESINHLAVMEAAAQAVGYAHAHEVIHRDLKPQNIMVGAFGEVQVMDWGLSKVLVARKTESSAGDDPEATLAHSQIRTPRDSDHTQDGSVLGTPAYMPPEQAAGEISRVGKASDVFGLGAVWCRILIGQPPFTGGDAESVRRNAMRGKTEEALSRLDQCGADPEVVALCKRCLAVEPEDRPRDANEIAAQIAELRIAAEERAKEAERSRARAEVEAAEQAKRRRVVQKAAVAVAGVLLLGVVGTSLGLWRATIARGAALAAEKEADEKRIAAQDSEARAKADFELANEVKEFLRRDILQVAHPLTTYYERDEVALDADVRLRDVVVRAATRIEGRFQDRPSIEAEIRDTLGYSLLGMGRYDLAVGQYERVVASRRNMLGADHPRTLRNSMNLATCYANLNRHAEALRILEDVAKAQKSSLGMDHQDTLLTLDNLAACYSFLDRHADALELRQTTLTAQKTRFGPEHHVTLLSMLRLADAYSKLDRPQDALAVAEDAVARLKRRFGVDHPHTLTGLSELCDSYRKMNRHAEAVVLRQSIAASRTAKLGREHPLTLTALNHLGFDYAASGRHADALKVREETLTLLHRRYGPKHAKTLEGMHLLAGSLSDVGRHADALRVREEAAAQARSTLGSRHSASLNYEAGAIDSLIALKRSAEAVNRIEALIAAADGATGSAEKMAKRLVPRLHASRMRILRSANDSVGLRRNVESWEKRNLKNASEFYNAACFRAVTGEVQSKNPDANSKKLAADDAKRAMEWLHKAVAAGFQDRGRAERDKDLDFLRSREDFKTFLESLPKEVREPR